ncbi:amphiphysin isoform X6 [Epinephelus moara]|uniref:amphiphysin isoform X6 n=1 Tax=Epinephelus moara TaxID=300413 RepID=UPI00214F1194|nr:amphiphysin isoform X6 [Epinephelus moara]
MAEIKTGIFAKNVQKRLNRAQEKVLQKLGKADETKDEQFEQVVINFRRQESEGSRLQREMKAYMSAIKGMQQASINLTQSLHEVYEPDWHGKDDVMVIGKDCDALWEDFHNKLVDSTLLDLDAYLQQFPDLKTRVAKRSRKLIDYDSARHHVETLQMSGMKNDRKITKVSLVICDETWVSYSSCYLWCVQVLRGGQFVNQTCFCLKAEEELKKAQKVFDELNVGLQDELPTLWDSRVGFYITTFKSVTHLETKFHREISLVCRQLYEVMTKLSEQHSDKMFTIQGAPSDSGPLRLARTPSPPEDESPPDSPDFSSNHMLRPVSPGPPRPKSPTQLKKGPPVPPPPKVTPTKEVAEEQIIDLFGGEFLPAPSPSQPNERPGESLLDLDFDAFQPDDSVSPIPQTAVPWDMWSANTQTAEPVTNTFNGFSQDATVPSFFADFDKMNEVTAETTEAPEALDTEVSEEQDKPAAPPAGEEPTACSADEEPTASPAGEEPTASPAGEEPTAPSAGDEEEEPKAGEEPPSSPAGKQIEEPPRLSVGDQDTGSSVSVTEKKSDLTVGSPGTEKAELGEIPPVDEAKPSPDEAAPSEKMPIPSVVIEPASSNEGDDDRDADIISPTAISDNGVTAGNQPIKHMSPSGGVSGLPDDFLYKVETMHDFEAANSDELELKRGDIVLVVPTASVEDQDAGWLTGIKESDWLTLGAGAHKGLFPENFTQRLE